MPHKKLDLKKELEHLVKVCSSSDTPPEYCLLNDESPVQCEHRGNLEDYLHRDKWGDFWVKSRYKCNRKNKNTFLNL